MFLVQKANLSSHFRSTTKKPPHIPKPYPLAAQLFDDNVILHLKTLDLPQTSSYISLSWLSAAVSFLSTLHTEAEAQIHQIWNLKSDADDFQNYQAMYMDYSLKVLDLCNLISSAVHQLTDRRMLLNYSLRLLNFAGQIPANEKLNKAKDALTRSVNNTKVVTDEKDDKGVRAKALIAELEAMLGKLPRGGGDVNRTVYGLGVLTVIVGGVLVAGVFRETDLVKVRVPAEFVWADSVNGVVEVMKGRCDVILEVDEVVKQAVVVRDMVEEVVADGGGDGGVRVRLESGVKELGLVVKRFSDGVDGLTNGVNGLFRSVLKTRNGRLDI